MNGTRIVMGLVCGLMLTGLPSNAAELLRLEGRYIELVTDLENREEAETLVASFDAAVPQWTSFWKLSDDVANDWKVKAYVMQDKSVFAREGLIPDRVPNFPFGYALDDSVWVLTQPSPYYTRHLLLHEGAHSLAFHCFGGAGPTWFMEGTAELLATHKNQGSSTQAIEIPADRADVPYWGRFKKMSQLRETAAVPPIETVMAYSPTLTGDVESYGWSWAAAAMFSAYPEYRDEFIAAAKSGRDNSANFNRQFYSRLSSQWPVVTARWRVLASDFDFGFDWEQQRLEISMTDPVWDGQPIKRSVAANQGWQSAGVRVPGGTKVAIHASGQITLATEPKPWISEPPGVTIQYHQGRPLGQLLACVLPNQTSRHAKQDPIKIETAGDEAVIEVPAHSWLLFRVNDDVGDLDNNSGTYDVVIEKTN